MSPLYDACGHQCRHHKDGRGVEIYTRLWYVSAWSSIFGAQHFQNVAADSCDGARWLCMEAAPRWRAGEWVVEPVHGPVQQ